MEPGGPLCEHADPAAGGGYVTRGSRLMMALLAVGAVSLLAACTVRTGAVTGVSVTTDGEPAAVIAVCEGHINAAVLYWGDSDKNTVTWVHDGDITDLAIWPLSGGGDWEPNKPVPRLAADTAYTLYGATKDNSWSGVNVHFTTKDLAALKPGQVRYYVGYDERTQTARYAIVPLSDFRSKACPGGE